MFEDVGFFLEGLPDASEHSALDGVKVYLSLRPRNDPLLFSGDGLQGTCYCWHGQWSTWQDSDISTSGEVAE